MATKTTHWTFANSTERDAVVGAVAGDICVLISDSTIHVYSGATWNPHSNAAAYTIGGLPALPSLLSVIDIGDSVSYSGSGSTVLDVGGSLTSGTIVGATYAAACIKFAGGTDRITFAKSGQSDNLFSGGGSVFIAIRPSPSGVAGVLASTSTWSLAIEDELEVGPSITSRLVFRKTFSVASGVWQSERLVRVGSFQSVGITYDSGSSANNPLLYLNGEPTELTETVSPSGTSTTDVGSSVVLGNNSGGTSGFVGSLEGYFTWSAIISELDAAIAETRLDQFATRPIPGLGGAGTDIPGSRRLVASGDYHGTGARSAGALVIRAGDSTSSDASSEGGLLDIASGSCVNGPAGSLTVRGGDGVSTATVDIGGGSATGAGTGALVAFHGADNEGTGDGGPTTLRGGSANALGSGDGDGGSLGIAAGVSRVAGTPAKLVVRTSGRASGSGGATGDLQLTTKVADDIAALFGAQGDTTTTSGAITVSTEPGATAATAGDIAIIGGSTGAGSGNNPGGITITAGSITTAENSVTPAGVIITAGSTIAMTGAPGAAVEVRCGSNTHVTGHSSSPGGDFIVTPGQATGAGRDGWMYMTTGKISMLGEAASADSPGLTRGLFQVVNSSPTTPAFIDSAGTEHSMVARSVWAGRVNLNTGGSFRYLEIDGAGATSTAQSEKSLFLAPATVKRMRLHLRPSLAASAFPGSTSITLYKNRSAVATTTVVQVMNADTTYSLDVLGAGALTLGDLFAIALVGTSNSSWWQATLTVEYLWRTEG